MLTGRCNRSRKYNRRSQRTQFVAFLFIVFVGIANAALSQDLERIGKSDMFGLSGGINVNSVFYDATGMPLRRDPFNYFLSGNLNMSIYEWSVPLSFTYSNQHTTFQQPFNQYGLSPTYKWVTLHAGYRSMTFSNYTVNGHLFLGGGFDIAPGDKIKLSTFYGRLQKAVGVDSLAVNNIPAYQRMGGGMKCRIGNEKDLFELILFKAKDQVGSLPIMPDSTPVRPEENLVLGLNVGYALADGLTLKAEVAHSAITRDTRNEAIDGGQVYERLSFVFRPRASSSFYKAMKAALQYSFSSGGVGFSYERVDPGYRTLGAYYFNNNLENIALIGSAVLWDKKIRVNGQAGVQRNNLDNAQLSTMNRLSGAINTSVEFSPRLTSNISYSNFQTVINFRSQFTDINQATPYENLDTLNYRQIAQNANCNMSYAVSTSKERRQHLNVNLAFQKTADHQADIEQPTGARFYNLNSSYTMVLAEKDLTVTAAVNANLTESLNAQNKIYGPSASLRKTMLDRKFTANLTLSYNTAFVNDKRTSEITNIRLSSSYSLKDKHQFDLSMSKINRSTSGAESASTIGEVTIQFGYSYNFSMR